MTVKRIRFGAPLLAMTIAAPAHALATDLDDALAAGGTRLSSEEIAELVVGNTVTAGLGDKRFLFHYGPDNVISARLVEGNWSDEGFYGITDDDRVCVSMTKDEGRLRCLILVRRDNQLHKYAADGSASFELLDVEEGKTF